MMLSGWIVSLQNRTGYRKGHGLRPPPVKTELFESQAEAEARKRELRRQYPSVDVLICVTAAPVRQPKRRR